MMSKPFKSCVFGLITILLLGFVIGCNENPESDFPSGKENKGTVILKITDAPFPADSVAEANITIDWIKIYKDSVDFPVEENELEADSSIVSADSSIILIELAEPVTLNLLELTNGITETLVEVEIPAGIYKEIRLHVVEASIVLNDGTEFDLKVPGGNSSGLKVKMRPFLHLLEGEVNEVLLDFDVSRSFIMQGNMNKGKGKIKGFLFKPVIRAMAQVGTETGEVSGIVSDTAAVAVKNANLILLTLESDTLTSARSDENGFYLMKGILPGDYKLVCEKEEFVSQEASLSVVKEEITEQNFELVPESE